MTEQNRNLNVSGYKVINLANPQNEQDATTKGYVDEKDADRKAYVDNMVWTVHGYTPISNAAEYIHTINTKYIHMMNLAGICTVTTDIKLRSGKHTYPYADLVHIWLESVICSNRVWFDGQDLKNKYIQVQYKYPVIVKSWHLLVRYLDYKWNPVTYHWQFSDDGVEWYTTQQTQTAKCSIHHYNGNTHNILFTNNYVPNNGYHFWKMCVVQGAIPKEQNNQPWANILFMQLE